PDTIVLRGSLLKEDMRPILEAEAKTLLAEAWKTGTLPNPPATFPRLDSSGVRTTSSQVFGLLDAAFAASPRLKGFRLIHAELLPDGVLYLAGLAASEEQKDFARAVAVDAIARAIEDKILVGVKLERVDLRKVIVGSSVVDELLVIESLVPSRP